MQLTLIRHGEAAPPVMGNDTQRPLTERGHLQAQQTAEAVSALTQPDVFVVSPLLRAQQTLAHLQRYFPNVPVVVCDAIKPDDDAKVAVVPFYAFGSSTDSDWYRVSIGTCSIQDIDKIFLNLKSSLSKLTK